MNYDTTNATGAQSSETTFGVSRDQRAEMLLGDILAELEQQNELLEKLVEADQEAEA